MPPRRDSGAIYGSHRHAETERQTTIKRRQLERKASESELVNVLQIIQDAYYYTGFMQLAKYTAFLAMGIVMLLFHVSALGGTNNTAYFRTSVSNRLATKYLDDNMAWSDVQSFYDAGKYYHDFLTAVVTESEKIGLPKAFVKLGEYGNVTYARVIVNFKENCKISSNKVKTLGAECMDDNSDAMNYFMPNATSFSNATGIANDQYSGWHASPAKYYKFRSAARTSSEWHALVVINDVVNSTRQAFLTKLQEMYSETQLSLLARYAYSIGLDLIVQNTLDADDYAIFSLRAQRSGDGVGVDIEAFKKLSITTPGKRFLYQNRRDQWRRFVELLFWVAFGWMVGLDYIQYRLSRRQGHSITAYFRHFWNTYNWITNVLMCGWLVWFLVLYGSWSRKYDTSKWPQIPRTCDDFYQYEFYSAYYVEWVYVGMGFMLLVGMRMLQFTRLHPGVRVFHDIFSKTMRDLADFFAVFIFTLTLFGTCVYMIFQLNGGNPNWLTWEDGTSVLSRLAFQYGDYSEVYNDGIGAGRFAPVLTLIFWLSVMFLYIWSGNIFLSAVAYSYQSVREKNPQVEVFFLYEVVYRIWFLLLWYYWMLGGYAIHPHTSKSGNSSQDPESGASRNGNVNSNSITSDYGVQGSIRQSGTSTLPEVSKSSTPGSPADSREGIHGRLRNLGAVQVLAGWLHRVWNVYNRRDIDFHRLFYVKNPAKYPRRYMLCRWALASRPELKAAAAYFTDFSRYSLAEPTCDPAYENQNPHVLFRMEGANTDTLPPFMIQKTKVKPLEKDGMGTLKMREDGKVLYELDGEGKPKYKYIVGIPEFIDREQLKELLRTVQGAHQDTLTFASIPFLLPQRLTQYFLGYFWGTFYKDDIPRALAEVYDPAFMKLIESSFAIDEDEDAALTTKRDLKAEVANPIMKLEVKVQKLETELQEMKHMQHTQHMQHMQHVQHMEHMQRLLLEAANIRAPQQPPASLDFNMMPEAADLDTTSPDQSTRRSS